MSSPAHDLLGRVEREAAGEHREAAEHGAFALGQQVVAPVDRRLQRLLAGQHGACAAGQQPEAVVEPGRDLLDGEPAHRAPRPARWRAGCRRAGGRSARRRARSSAVSAKFGRTLVARSTNSRTASNWAGIDSTGCACTGSGAGSDGTRHAVSPGHAERLAAGREHGQRLGSGAAARRPASATRVEQVLAVVEDDQRRLAADADRDRLDEIAAQVAFAERGRDGRRARGRDR